jgi:hypothetical protein
VFKQKVCVMLCECLSAINSGVCVCVCLWGWVGGEGCHPNYQLACRYQIQAPHQHATLLSQDSSLFITHLSLLLLHLLKKISDVYKVIVTHYLSARMIKEI